MTRRKIRGIVLFGAVLALAGLTRLAHAQPSIYWTDTYYFGAKLGRANPDGTNPSTMALPSGSLPEGLALDAAGGRLYWTEGAWSGANVNRQLATLGGRVALVTGESSLHGIALDIPNGKMYWTSSNLVSGATIERANLDGTSHSVVAALGGAANPRGIVVDAANSRVIWADYDAGQIRSCGLAGGTVSTLGTTLAGVWGLALDPATGRLFLTNYISGSLQTSLSPYSTFTNIVTGLGNPTYVAVDGIGGKVYWSEAAAGAQRVQRANLDGTLVQNLNLPIAAYGGLAVGNPAIADVPPPEERVITAFALAPPTPNPARSLAQLEFDLPQAARVLLRVIDVQGREVARLADGDFDAGRHHMAWNLGDARSAPAAGVYFVRFEAAGHRFTRRLAVVR